jgi:transposase
LARGLFAVQAAEYQELQEQIDSVEAKLAARHKADTRSRRLAKIPGVGPIVAALLQMRARLPSCSDRGDSLQPGSA